MIYDLFNFSGEYDVLEIHLNVVWPYADKFIIVESPMTFSGVSKPLYFNKRDKERFKKYEEKIVYFIPDTEYKDKFIVELMNKSPLTPAGLEHYRRAFYQKECGRIALEILQAKDEDIVYYGDVDEIWKPKHADIDDKNYKLRQLAYSYFLNNRSPEDWKGTIVTKYKNIKNGSLNALRADQSNILEDGGWHFTNILSTQDSVIRKIESYDHQEANIPWVKDGMVDRIKNNEDFLGRGWKFWVDEKDLPKYVLENKAKYSHIWK